MATITYISLLLLAFLQLTEASYSYYTSGNKPKCFSQGLMKDTLLTVEFSIAVPGPGGENDHQSYIRLNMEEQDLSLHFTVTEDFDDDHEIISQVGPKNGKFVFTAVDNGIHTFCMKPVSGGYTVDSMVRVTIDTETGRADTVFGSPKEFHSKEQELHGRIAVLREKLESIRNEFELVRERESIFRDLSESVNSSIVRWVLFQACVLAGCSYFLLVNLSTFFVKQKVI